MIIENKVKSQEVLNIVSRARLNLSEIGIAVIDLKSATPEIFGINLDHFIYPASVYKVFIGAEVLRQIETGKLSLGQIVSINSPNDVDQNLNLFPGDKRDLLKAGDKVTINYLLDLMLTRSDNTASNVLIDLVGRENITKNIVEKYNWHGSGVTRKFLDRTKEDADYRFTESTKTCARHMAEFMYLVERGELISPFVSSELKEYMSRWNRGGKQGLTLPEYLFIYRKGGYLENNLYSSVYKNYYHKSGFGFDYAFVNIWKLIKNIFIKGWAFICWQNDIAVVTGNSSKYVIAVFSVTKSLNPRKRFPIRKLAEIIYDYMETRENLITPN